MTDKDYLAISNTGKNITISMTPGMKQRVLGTHDRVRLRLGRDNSMQALGLVPCAQGYGYKLFRRKNVWSMSMSSKWLAGWPKHERVVLGVSQIDMTEPGAVITLPKPTVDMDSMLKNLTEKLRREMPPPPPTPIDHPAMNRPVLRRDEPAMRREYINLAGEYFEVLVESEDHARFWKAYQKTLKRQKDRLVFNVPDMVVAAITGGAIGAVFTLIMMALGWVK